MRGSLRKILVSATALTVIAIATQPVVAAETREQLYDFNIPAQDLGTALNAFARAANQQVTFDPAAVRGKQSAPLAGRFSARAGIEQLLLNSGLTVRIGQSGLFIVQSPSPSGQGGAGAGGEFPGPAARSQEFNEIIVTAQKREERINDVPIAITALTADGLNARKIEGGSELLRAIPNVNFSKSNFSMYNFSIRGVGTKAVSASSDPAVAVSFNNTPLVRNRLFESEFFDMARVEVLRGPQGTLYGRNATAGVVNMIPALPEQEFGGEIKGELGNYSTKRASGMLNVPMTDTLALRVAGAWTKRGGFDYNTFTENRVNDRDLWSTRASVLWEPSDHFRASVIWQHFEENDKRSRTGKQLCTTDPGPEKIGNVTITDPVVRGRLSQGCQPGSLYDDAAYGTPNGNSLVNLHMLRNITLGNQRNPNNPRGTGGPAIRVAKSGDPFEGVTQSRNLREIAASIDPVFRAKNDVLQFNLDFDVADGLQLVSQTAYSRDRFHSMQDYNRFITNPIFNDSTQELLTSSGVVKDTVNFPGPTPGGVFCDPQLGCSDRMVSADISHSRNRQWSQELRLQSSFDGPVNFNIGANYLDFKSQDNYYVFNNTFTLLADWFYSKAFGTQNALQPCELGNESRECPYVDRNPIDRLDNQGHNYFLSQNGVRIKSWAAFGELYLNVSDTVNLTLGLRYTRDKKVADQVPSQLLLGGGVDRTDNTPVGDTTGGRVNSGYPALEDIEQTWGKFTGRAVLDWKPELSFTDDTLVYFSAARGYKGGGVNPPRVDFNPDVVQYQFLPQTFKPEYVTSLEIGTKNSFNGGRVTLNANAFLYNYKDYQVSQIVDRIAFNENFDAVNWGLELEAAWRPTREFRLDGNLGYLRTRLKKGSKSIDVMDRTQGDPDWVVLRPWLQVPSNCVAPRAFVEKILAANNSAIVNHLAALCPGASRIGSYNPSAPGKFYYHNTYGFTYDPFADYNPDTVGRNIADRGSGAPNGGRGFYADLTGNELPNAPRWTLNIGAQYAFFSSGDDWELTFRADYYWQAKSYARVYNTAFDRLKAWDNLNLSATYIHSPWGLTVQAYVKNVFNDAPITDAFLNSDDTGLTTNVFTLDPRLFGVSISKKF